MCFLSNCLENNLKSYGWILMKFSGRVDYGTRNKLFDFGSGPMTIRIQQFLKDFFFISAPKSNIEGVGPGRGMCPPRALV